VNGVISHLYSLGRYRVMVSALLVVVYGFREECVGRLTILCLVVLLVAGLAGCVPVDDFNQVSLNQKKMTEKLEALTKIIPVARPDFTRRVNSSVAPVRAVRNQRVAAQPPLTAKRISFEEAKLVFQSCCREANGAWSPQAARCIVYAANFSSKRWGNCIRRHENITVVSYWPPGSANVHSENSLNINYISQFFAGG
jgi:hypothetical protein